MMQRHLLRSVAAVAATLLFVAAVPASAQTAKPAAKPASKSAKAPPAPVFVVPDATPDQVKAADMVFYGRYACEFDQNVEIAQSPKHSAYVDVKHGKGSWLMKPVLSSTGAIRLEDVKNETLMVQIASKSMLLNVKTGRRVVDECVSPKQRELIEAAKLAKAAEAAGSAPAATPTAGAAASAAAPAATTDSTAAVMPAAAATSAPR